PVADAAQAFWKDLKSRYDLLKGDRDRPLLEPRELYLPVEEFFVGLAGHERVDIIHEASDVPPLEVDRRSVEPLAALKAFTDGFGGRTLLVAESPGRRETLSSFFAEHGFHPALVDDWNRFLESAHPVALTYGPLQAGFVLPGEQLALVTEAELYPGQVRQSRRRDNRARS